MNTFSWSSAFLIAMLLFFAIRLLGFAVFFSHDSLQMDLSAFYTAGEALRLGLDPYKNNLTAQPSVWDGYDVYQHSRFLYPPLAAWLFQAFAFIPYEHFKLVWNLAQPILLFGICLMTILHVKDEIPIGSLGVGFAFGFAAMFYPMITLLERGQVDIVTLFIIFLGIGLVEQHGRSLMGGIVLGLSILLKLHIVYLAAFLVIRRKWRALAGVLIGMSLWVFVGCLVAPRLNVQYITQELPRISRYGEGGPASWVLEEAVSLRRNERGVPLKELMTVKQGRTYRTESFDLGANNASLARVLFVLLGKFSYTERIRSLSATSVVVFVLLFLSIVLLMPTKLSRRVDQLAFWTIALCVTLLSAPVTWVMNAVWLIPSAVLLLYFISRARFQRSTTMTVITCIFALGLFLAGMSDQWITFNSPVIRVIWRMTKYVLAELGVLVSLMIYLCFAHKGSSNLKLRVGT